MKTKWMRWWRWWFTLSLVVATVLGPAVLGSAETAAGEAVAQEEVPYQPPDFEAVEVPDWLEPLAPLGGLPLWGQAAVLSAGVAGLFFIVPMVARWVWRLGDDEERDSRPGGIGR